MIKDEDFETPLPNVDPVSSCFSASLLLSCNLNHFQNEDRQPWQPTLTRDNLPYPPVPGRVMNVFCATSRLGKSYSHFQSIRREIFIFSPAVVILGAIVTQIYPVRSCNTGVSRQAKLADLESRLDQWYITLPDELQLEASPKRHTQPPQVLFLHVRYWGAVLILHRAL
jgi:hypothetical protein